MLSPSNLNLIRNSWRFILNLFCGLVLLFLILPILIIIPLSFNAEPYFTFTRDMLTFESSAWSLRWYQDILGNPQWLHAIRNSFIIGIASTIPATVLGTLAALGLSRSQMPLRATIMGILLSPMIVPIIISATGMYFFTLEWDCRRRMLELFCRILH